MVRITYLSLLVIFAATCIIIISFIACGTEKDSEIQNCECPIEEISTIIESTSSTSDTISRGLSGNIEFKPNLLKKLIKTEFGIEGNIKKGAVSSETVYRRLVNERSDVVQGANLFRVVACALIQITCEDPSLTDKEKSLEKKRHVKEFNTKVTEIWEESNVPLEDSPTSPEEGNQESNNHQAPTKGTAKLNYFASNSFNKIAVLQTGDKSIADLSLNLRDWFLANNYSSTANLFNPIFYGTFKSRLTNQDLSVFTELNAQRHTNCVCLFNQSAKFEESEIAGNKIVTSIFSGEIILFNLKSQDANSFGLNIRGSGITPERAMESVGEKLSTELHSYNNFFKQCQ